jgi:hypothetical protein
MPSDDNQRVVFEFFVEHLETKESFSKQELEQLTTWQGQSFNTYWSKLFRPFLVKDRSDARKYHVTEAFRRIATWEKFRQHVTQVRSLELADYEPLKYDLVRIYEFFMPLTNEGFLRAALDALFYRDTIEARLKTIDSSELRGAFPQQESESEADYINRLCMWLSDRFGGYSIYHVNGRFRAGDLVTRSEAGASTSRYLIDETTAVTRFIFPCDSENEANRVEFFFTNLFVRAIIEVVNGEDEIWMVETGMKNRLHIWRMKNS